MLKPFRSLLLILVCLVIVHELVKWVGFEVTGIHFASILDHVTKKNLSFGEADKTIDFSLTSPAQAKKQKKFWLERANDSLAVDVLHTPEYFTSMYPGYPAAMAEDDDLWTDYFHRFFEIDSFVPAVAKDISPTFVLVHSWIGCLDIYRRYGADYLIIGTSEAFHDAVPEFLSQALVREGKSPKVLLCAGSALQLDSTVNLAHHLRTLRPDLKPVILFGYSKMTAFVEGKANIINGLDKREELNDFDLYESRAQSSVFKSFEKYHILSFSSFVPRITWDDVYPETQDSYSDRQLLGIYPHLAEIPQRTKNDKRLVKMDLLNNPNELRKNIESRISPYFHVYKDFNPKFCDSPRAEETWNQVVDSLKAISSHLFVYIPPTTPLESLSAPQCLVQRMDRQLNDLKKDAQVSVLNHTWDWFGLDYPDFVRATRDPSVGIVDVQHTNFKGAEKVSKRLGEWLKAGNNP